MKFNWNAVLVNGVCFLAVYTLALYFVGTDAALVSAGAILFGYALGWKRGFDTATDIGAFCLAEYAKRVSELLGQDVNEHMDEFIAHMKEDKKK